MRKLLIPGLLCLVLGATSTGCFGKFALTRKLYRFNETVSKDKFVRSIVTWALVIIPVYELGALADFVVLNTIEFWTGSNPVTANDRCDEKARVALVEQPDGSAAFECGQASYRLVPSGAASFVVERDGVPIGTAETTDGGGLLLMDAQGNVMEALTAAEVDARAADAALLASAR